MHARRKSQQPQPQSGEESRAATPPATIATDAARREAWKQSWLDQADRRGAVWHTLWKEALVAKRVTKPGSTKDKKS